MSRTGAIKSNLANEGMGGLRDKSSQEAPVDGDDWTISLLKSLIAASGKSVKEAAFDLGMSETHLADHCAGRRMLQAHRLERFVQRNPETAIVLAAAYLQRAKIKAVVKRKRVDKKTAHRQMSLELRQSAELFDIVAERAARSLGASKQEVIDAWNEPTNVDADDE